MDRIRDALGAARDWWALQRLSMRLGVITATGAAVAVVALVGILVAGGEAAEPAPEETPDVVVSTPPPSTPTPTQSPTPSPSPTPRPTPPPQRDPVAQMSSNLLSFVDAYGLPDDADFAVLRIPVIGLETRVSSSFVGRGEAMEDPTGPAHVYWYDLTEYRNMGGVPGEGGNAIFSGHVDYNWTVGYAGNPHYRGEGMFFHLHQLEEDDLIEVDYNGETYQYKVVWVELYNADPNVTDWGAIWRSTEGLDEITLYSCGGAFDPVTRSYRDRVVVRAVEL